jgi:hypothetical protein
MNTNLFSGESESLKQVFGGLCNNDSSMKDARSSHLSNWIKVMFLSNYEDIHKVETVLIQKRIRNIAVVLCVFCQSLVKLELDMFVICHPYI